MKTERDETPAEDPEGSLRSWVDKAMERVRRQARMVPEISDGPDGAEPVIARIRRRGIPELFWRSRLNDFDGTDREKFPTHPTSTRISGGNGVGKSHLAAALCLHWDGWWVSAPKLLVMIQSTFRRNSEVSTSEVLEEFASWSVLVIDDLCAGNPTEFTQSSILYLINERIERCKVTIVTLDRSLESIHNRDSSLASRLGSFFPVKLSGPDRRIQ